MGDYWNPMLEDKLANLIGHLTHWDEKYSGFMTEGKIVEARNANETIEMLKIEIDRVGNENE